MSKKCCDSSRIIVTGWGLAVWCNEHGHAIISQVGKLIPVEPFKEPVRKE